MYCLCVNVYCHRVSTQLQLTNISIYQYQIYTVLSQSNPMHILITSCCLTRLVLNCHLCLGFPLGCFPGRFSPKAFHTSVLPCFILNSFVRRSIAHSDRNYVPPATFHVGKSVLNCIEIHPLDWERPHFMHIVQKARNDYITSLLR
jgi:hypothetical protein